MEHELGFGVRCDATPRAHMLNLLRVGVADCSPAALAAACEELQAGLTHRKAEVTDAALGARLAPALRSTGWQAEPLVVMAHRRPPDRPAAAGVAEQVDPALLEQTERQLGRELMPDAEAGLVAELTLARRRLRAAAATRCFVGFHLNAPAGHATLLVRDAVAQVEDVATASFARGRGVARALVLAAVDDARRDGAQLTYLHADRDGWVRELYVRLGFDPVGELWSFTRDAPARGPGTSGGQACSSRRIRRPPA